MIKEMLESNNKAIAKTYIKEYNHEYLLEDIVYEYFEPNYLLCEPLAFIEACEELGLITEHIDIQLLCSCFESDFENCLSFLYKKYDIDNVQFNYLIENYTLLQHDSAQPIDWVKAVTLILDNMNISLSVDNLVLLSDYGKDVYRKALEYKNHKTLMKEITLDEYIELKIKG